MSTQPEISQEQITAKRVKEAREGKGLSVAELAKLAGVSKAYVHQIESGACPRPSADVLFRIATTLGTSIAFLLGKDVNRPEREAPEIPPSLRDFATSRQDVKSNEIVAMALIRKRGGSQQMTKEDWELLWISLKRTVWRDDQ